MGAIPSISTLEPFRKYSLLPGERPAIEWINDTKCLAYATDKLTVIEVFKNSRTTANLGIGHIEKLQWVSSRQQLLALSGRTLSFVDITDLSTFSKIETMKNHHSVVCESIDKFALVSTDSVTMMDFEHNLMSRTSILSSITNACYLQTRPTLALSTSNGISLFDIPSSREVQTKKMKSNIYAVDYNTKLGLLACPGDSQLKIYNPNSGNIEMAFSNLPDVSNNVKWLTDDIIGLSRSNGDLIIYDIRSSLPLLHKRYASNAVNFAIHSRLNLLAATGSRKNKLKCWDLRTH